MAQDTQLRRSRKDVEVLLKHFLNHGHKFHSSPETDPGLALAEAQFEKWSTDAELALKRCFSTEDIAKGFGRRGCHFQMDLYAHIAPEMKREAVEQMNAILG
ncbi:MAG: hypothetical protein ACR2HX_13905 [Pyrinomonadaceae bacterium]